MDRQVRILQVGVGARGKKGSRILNEEPFSEIVGYVDLNTDNLEWVKDTYNADSNMCYTDMETALKELKPELVLLVTPPMDRYREVLTIFDHGAHILSEKPLSIDFEEGMKMVRASEEAKLGFAVGLNFRYQHSVVAAREIIKSGEIGAPRYAGYNYWRNRDGYAPGANRYPLTLHQAMLYDQTIHHFDEIRFVYDSEVESVMSYSSNPPWSMYKSDATITTFLQMSGGLEVHYFGTWSGQTKFNQFMWRTDCDNGSLFQYDLFADLRIVRGNDSDVMEKIDLPYQETLVDDARIMLHNALTQIMQGSINPEPTAIDHLKTFAVAAACEESSKTNKPVKMADFYDQHNVPEEWR